MIGRIVLGLGLACLAGAASAQDAACTMYKVNTSLLNVSKDAGGDIYNDALFDGDTTCVTRLANVKGIDWGFIAYKIEGSNRTTVEGWAALQYLQPTAPGAATAPAAPPAPPQRRRVTQHRVRQRRWVRPPRSAPRTFCASTSRSRSARSRSTAIRCRR
jgi:hypothetical protein